MANRIPLIVDSTSNQIKELPDGDSIILGDSEKLIFGDGSDLQITHNGSNSLIGESGTGDLYIYGENNIYLANNVSGSENYLSATKDGAVSLFYDNSAKLATASGGVTITGEATATKLQATTSARIEQVALSSGTNVTWDGDAAGNAYLLLGHNVTIGKASNGNEGQIIQIEIAQPGSGGPYTVAWHTDYEFAASTAPTMTATASKTDIFTFRYNGSIWQEIGRVQNLAQT